MSRVHASLVAFIVGFWATQALAPPAALHAPAGSAVSSGSAVRDSALWIDMRNVDLHIDATTVMHVRSLHGEVVAAPGVTPWLDDPTTFRIRETAGTVALDGAAITALLNEVAFAYPGAPLHHLVVRIANGRLEQRGILHKGVDIPFDMTSVPVLDSDGRLRLHPATMKIFGVNGLRLMGALGLHLSRMMNLSGSRGAAVDGDDILLDPLQIIPPPMVEGRVVAVRIEDSLLVQDFARSAADTLFGTYVRPDSGSHNYIYFRGGKLKFGKLTMESTDLLIHDADERDPFDLYFKEYNRQLVAGYTHNLPDLGLRTWMVDYNKLPAREGAPVAVAGSTASR